MAAARFHNATSLKPVLLASLLFWAVPAVSQRTVLYGVVPGTAKAEVHADAISLSNQMMEGSWSVAGGKLTGLKLVVRRTGEEVSLPNDPFSFAFTDGTSVKASEMTITDGPRIDVLGATSGASREAEHYEGQAVVLGLQDTGKRMSVVWRAELRDGSNYVRQEIAVSATDSDQAIADVRLFDGSLPGASVVGTVNGSPVTAGDLFLGFEDPLAKCQAGETVVCSMKRLLPLRKGQAVHYSLVIGVAPPGQMRRGFLNYVERERAHPYRTFLHYNSWYDIGYGKPYDASAVLDVIEAFGRELVRKRGVKLDSFLLDDGWDNPQSLWRLGQGFPHGLAPLKDAAQKYGAEVGMWLSPWGGYNEAKQQRLDSGRSQGFETNQAGFTLSGPKYYARFREVTLGFIQKDGVNQFKIDGTGNVDTVFPGSAFDSDFAAAISLIRDWRTKKPDLYVNLTTGTYPSPFWLQYADSIWRGGGDDDFAGVGPWRERWITHRDAETYRGVVQRGPLFPLNSVMLHGLIFARQAKHLDSDPENDFQNEIHAYFGSGTQLQELYVSHALLSKSNWDLLAEAANWSRRNAHVLRDTHWVGGDPGKLEVYGWASWSPAKAILTLRNPSDGIQEISLDVGQAFDLPAEAARRFRAHSPWKHDRDKGSLLLVGGQEHAFTLEPFEVLTLEAVPAL